VSSVGGGPRITGHGDVAVSLWSLFIALTALAVALSMGAAVWRPRDGSRHRPVDMGDDDGARVRDGRDVLTALQARIENLEAEVDDLNRLTTALREETENLQQRLDAEQGGFRTGEGS